jgi:hypothetical protein
MKIPRFFARIPWIFLLPVAVVLGLAPFRPEPHLVEKLRMLVNGQLTAPIDVFDLFMHGVPLLLIAGKLVAGRVTPVNRKR